MPKLPDKLLTGGSGGTFNNPNSSQANGPSASNSSSITKLPTVDEAWTLPIPAELTQRQLQLMLQEASNSSANRSDRYLAGLLLSPTLKFGARKRGHLRHLLLNSKLRIF